MEVFWGDTHTNIHESHMPDLERTFQEAREHLDFFMIAYYPADMYRTERGLLVESVGTRPEYEASWERVLDAVARYNDPGRFVTFPGYEWTGDRTRWGDVNIFHFDKGELDLADSLPELHEHFRGRKALIIPHHTGYQVEDRGKDWSCHDPAFSPVTEVFSGHGSSEGCLTPIPLHRNTSMGPRTSGGTTQDGLNRGLRLGIIASNDSHYGYPGVWGCGLVAARAESLTREAIWDAFFQRRVYGVTGDRILLDFEINGCPMGGELNADGPLTIEARVTGSAALDRIELIRDGRVAATHCHADTWPVVPEGDIVRFKVRVEYGWGPKPAKGFPDEEREWNCGLALAEGRILSVEGCFTWPGQRIERVADSEAAWHLCTPNSGGSAPWTSAPGPAVPGIGSAGNQAVVLELEMPRDAAAALTTDGEVTALKPAEMLTSSRLIAFKEEARQKVRDQFGLDPGQVENRDVFYHNAYKLKVHRAAPAPAYEVSHRFNDTPSPGTHYYYLRVTQLNGQMAWSSPIWVAV